MRKRIKRRILTSTDSSSTANDGAYSRDVTLHYRRRSVRTQVRVQGILAGAAVAFGIYLMLGILGAGAGLSISTKLIPSAPTNGAIFWTTATTCLALFTGGVVLSMLAVAESKVKAAFYGIIMWAMLLTFFMCLSEAGINTGSNSMADLFQTLSNESTPEGWEPAARQAGMTSQQIDEMRTTLALSPDPRPSNAQARATLKENANRTTWAAIAGILLSIGAAMFGAILSAGSSFRQGHRSVPPVRRSQSR